MINTLKLKGAIAESRRTQSEIAAVLNISKNTMTSKVLGRSSFTVDEANLLCKYLNIVEPRKKAEIFLP